MPINPCLREIISQAAARAEPILYPYPKHFYDIEAAKSHVQSICNKQGFKYSDVLCLTFQEKEYIKDKVHFIVAAKAFEQGEFSLDKAMQDRNALRASIESDIHRILTLTIKPSEWPRIFLDANAAKAFVSCACAVKNFVYTDFPGIEHAKYKGYVDFNTARHAFEAGFFQTEEAPPRGWVRKQRFNTAAAARRETRAGIQKRVPVARAEMRGTNGSCGAGTGAVKIGLYPTLKDAIEADMTRLTALIPCWPPSFPSLNAARDHVAGVSRAKCFSYTYWPDLEPYRFRMFVNFNTAKQAFRKRAFCVIEEERVAEARADWAAAVRTSEEYEKSEGEVTDTEHVTSESEEQGCTAVIATAVEDEPTQMLDCDTDRDSDAASISPFDELEVRLRRVEEQVGHVPKGREDPFKNLLAAATRASTLKAAFG